MSLDQLIRAEPASVRRLACWLGMRQLGSHMNVCRRVDLELRKRAFISCQKGPK